MFQMMGVFAEFEHSMVRGCVNAGLARARAEGISSASWQRLLAGYAAKVEAMRAARRTGKSIRTIARARWYRAAIDGVAQPCCPRWTSEANASLDLGLGRLSFNLNLGQIFEVLRFDCSSCGSCSIKGTGRIFGCLPRSGKCRPAPNRH
jgi:hypothetical protein